MHEKVLGINRYTADYPNNLAEIANAMFTNLNGKKSTGFYFGEDITIVDFVVGGLFSEIMKREPTLLPVWMD